MIRRLGLGIVAGLLLLGTGCFERFEQLLTRVDYDPATQHLHVERTLVNVSAGFLLCSDADTCEQAIWRALAGEGGGFDATLADRLVQRLVETGAEDVKITLRRRGDALDVVASYGAAVGSRAAEDTTIRPEWGGKNGKETYYLVVDAQPGMRPIPDRHTLRKVAAAAGWTDAWVLTPGDFSVETALDVEDVQPIFAQIPGLSERIADWLDHEWTLGAPPARPDGAVEPPPVAVVEAPEDPPPSSSPPPPPVVARTDSWPAPDPTAAAKVWVYDPRIDGGYPPEAARVAFAGVLPRIEWCYQQRVAAIPGLGGYLFLDAVVQPDGAVTGLSAYGDVPDRDLLLCANRAIEDWRFAPFSGAAEARVSFPLALRVEVPPELPGKKKK